MSCESCIAARQAETAAFIAAREDSQKLANENNQPVFLLLDNGNYYPSLIQQPNTIEVFLPRR